MFLFACLMALAINANASIPDSPLDTACDTPLPTLSVDFDTALGKNDSYLQPFFDTCMLSISQKGWPALRNRWFKYLIPGKNAKETFEILKDNYEKKRFLLKRTQKTKIPLIFHQIWIGKKPFPERYKLWQKTWQSVPGWQYKFWTDKEVETFAFRNRSLYEQEKNIGARADILRLEILYQEGGVYIDTDFECLNPALLELLNNTYDFYSSLHPLDCNTFLLNNAILACIPGHPIIKACIDSLAAQSNPTAALNDVVLRGPGLLTNMTFKYMNKDYSDMVLPSTIFYPLGVWQMWKEPFKSLSLTEDKTFEIIKNEVIKPESVAVHWWDGSWTKDNSSQPI